MALRAPRRRRVGNAAGEGLRAARILEAIGEQSDILRLRTFARAKRGRRRIRSRSHSGTPIGGSSRCRGSGSRDDRCRRPPHSGRRFGGRCLALLCFLLTRPDMSSTRDQVLDALWPELDPLDALNSLNQTVYFLRRVLEEPYVDDLSPGYLHHDSDLIWLDPELVTSSKQRVPRVDQGPSRRRPPRTRSIGLGRCLPRAVRPRLRIRGVGSAVPRLASRVVPRNSGASRHERPRNWALRPRDHACATRPGCRSKRRARRGVAAAASIGRAGRTLRRRSSTRTTQPRCANSSGSSPRPSRLCRDR